MKKIILLLLVFFLGVPCFAEDDGFMEEIIDIDFIQDPQMQEKPEKEVVLDEEQNKIDEFNAFKKQNEKDVAALKRKIDSEEDGIVRLELENQVRAKNIEYQSRQYILDWANKVDELKIHDILKEASNVKKQTSDLLDGYENLLEEKNDFMIDRNKMSLSQEQDCSDLEESIIIKNKNKVLVLMINTMKPFIQRLNKFQKEHFAGDGKDKVKISSLYKSKNYVNLKVIYTGEQTAIYNLKYNISDLDEEDQELIGKSSKEFTIKPVFSVTQNNNGTLAKVLTGFKIENSVVENEQVVNISANIKEIFEIYRYKKMLTQYND